MAELKGSRGKGSRGVWAIWKGTGGGGEGAEETGEAPSRGAVSRRGQAIRREIERDGQTQLKEQSWIVVEIVFEL